MKLLKKIGVILVLILIIGGMLIQLGLSFSTVVSAQEESTTTQSDSSTTSDSSSSSSDDTVKNSGSKSDGKEDALDRVKNQLALAAGKASASGAKSEFTVHELQTVGFFLSNYYTPFVTRISNEDGAYSAQDIATVLEQGAGINADFAKELSEMVVGNMKSAKSTNLAVSHDGGKTWNAGQKATYFDILMGSVGVFKPVDLLDTIAMKGRVEGWDTPIYSTYYRLGARYGFDFSEASMGKKIILESNDDVTKIDGNALNESLKSGQVLLGLTTKSGKVERADIVYDWNPFISMEGAVPTAAQTVFIANFSALDTRVNIGGSIFAPVDVLRNENGVNLVSDTNPVTAIMNHLYSSSGATNVKKDAQFIFEHSIYGWGIELDGFGNLIMVTGGGLDSKPIRYIMMPGSQNPYFFAKKSSSDVGTATSNANSDSSSSGSESGGDNSNEATNENNVTAQRDDNNTGGSNTDTGGSSSSSGSSNSSSSSDSGSGSSDSSDSKSDSDSSSGSGDEAAGISSKEEYLAWMREQMNNESSGIGKMIPVNNLNTIALIQEKGFARGGSSDKMTFGTTLSSDQSSIRTVFGSSRNDWDEGAGIDWGASVNDMLLTQAVFKLFKGGVGEGTRLGKASVGGSTVYEMSKKSWLQIRDNGENTDRVTSVMSFNSNSLSEFNTYHSNQASVSGDADTNPDTIKNVTGEFGVIDSLITFDKFDLNKAAEGYGEPGDVIKNSNVFSSGTTIAIQGNTGKMENGFYKGNNTSGKLTDSLNASAETINYSASIFVSYLIARADPMNAKVDYIINLDGVPEVSLSNKATGDNHNDIILKNMAYYLLNPTVGRHYKQRWAKTFTNAILLQAHADLIGANSSNANAGRTRYLNMTGFTTMPLLTDIELVGYVYNNFATWGILLVIVALLVTLWFIFIGQMGKMGAIVSLLIFSVMLYIPPKIIDGSINITNSISDSFYKDKFLFWALYQHQNYEDALSALIDAGDAGDTTTYNQILLTIQGGTGGENASYTENGGIYEWQKTMGAAVKVRWMSPKKDGYVEQINNAIRDEVQNLSEGVGALVNSTVNRSVSQEEFIQDMDAAYLYRGYTDISDYSRFYYGNIMGDQMTGGSYATASDSGSSDGVDNIDEPSAENDVNVEDNADSRVSIQSPSGGGLNHEIGDTDSSLARLGLESTKYNDMVNYLNTVDAGSLFDRKTNGFINDRQDGIIGGINNKAVLKRIYAPISSETVSSQANKSYDNISVGDAIGLNKSYFMATIRDFNNHTKPMGTILSELNKNGTSVQLDSGDATSLGVFAIFTESPFYYFSWGLYDQGLKVDKGSSDTFRKMMLEKNDAFFYNYAMPDNQNGYGSMKDFLDIGTMFKVTIPYLKQMNKPLVDWSAKYGTKPYAGYSASPESLAQIPDTTSEEYYKTWFNVTLDNLFRTYSGWVDVMYETDLAKPTEISYGGNRQVVEDPLSPASYTIRPMIFSRSEMAYYGLEEVDLTDAEKAILKTLDDTRRDWFQLMNYANLDDAVLNTAASMIATFNFNKNFSQTGLWRKNYILEPQGFELKQFAYDGYLRLILQNASNESIFYNKELKLDIYEMIAEKSGTLTLIAMTVGSFLAVFVTPALKLVMILVLPFSILLSVMATMFRGDRKYIQQVIKYCLAPFYIFIGATVLHSFLISLMMGDGGVNSVTGSSGIGLNFQDPTMTIVILAIMSLSLASVYFFVLRQVFKGIFFNSKIISTPIKGALAGAIGGTVSLVGKLETTVSGGNGTGRGSGSRGYSDGYSGRGYSSNPYEQGWDNVGSPESKSRRRAPQGVTRRQEKETRSSIEAQRAMNEALRESETYKASRRVPSSDNTVNRTSNRPIDRTNISSESSFRDLLNDD